MFGEYLQVKTSASIPEIGLTDVAAIFGSSKRKIADGSHSAPPLNSFIFQSLRKSVADFSYRLRPFSMRRCQMLAPIYKCICEEITSLRLQLRRHLWPSDPAIFTRRPLPASTRGARARRLARTRAGKRERASTALGEIMLGRDAVKNM